jgi:hypothetical protein
MSRNYVAELRALIDAETSHGAYVPRQVAEKLVAYLRETDPDLLAGWLDEQAEHFIWQMINDRDRSRRAQGKERANRVAFAAAAGQYAEGDAAALTTFLDMPFPVETGERKRLGDLDAHDLRYVATEYEERARENAMTAAFLRALSRKVGRSTVAEKFDEARLAKLWTSLVSAPT